MNSIAYIEEQLVPMGLILILFLILCDEKFSEKIKSRKPLKILAYIIIAIYYIGIFVKALKIGVII